MKNFLLTSIFALITFGSYAQVTIDKQVQMTGAAANDRRITNVSNASSVVALGTDAANINTVQSNYLNYNIGTFAAGVYTVVLSPVPPATLWAGMIVTFRASAANTGATTIQITGAGAARSIVKSSGAAISAGEISAGQMVVLAYDITSDHFEMISSPAVLGFWGLTGNTAAATDYIGTNNAINFRFYTNNTQKMVLNTSGQLGINFTTVPATDLVASGVLSAGNAIAGYSSLTGTGLYGQNTGTGWGVYADQTLDGASIQGTSTATSTASSTAVLGYALGLGDAGYFRINNNSNASTGVTSITNGRGRAGEFYNTLAGNTDIAIAAFHSGDGRVINAQNTLTTSVTQVGLFFQNSTGTGLAFNNAAAVWGQSTGIRNGVFLSSLANTSNIALTGQVSPTGNYDGVGVFGYAGASAGWGYGVYGQGNWRALFGNGNFAATGTKAFQIDHPKDPENKFLMHYSIESPEVLNVYRGNVVLDGSGEAIVKLPNYFNDININFSYVLTPIGAPASLYVKTEVNAAGEFRVAGGNAGMKVSWYVYAERNDKFVQEYPFSKSVEMEKKPHEKGKYLRPELYGQPEEKGIFFQYKASPILQATPNTQPVLKEKTTENFKIDK